MDEAACVAFVNELKKLTGAISYDGDYSCQVMFKLANGDNLRIGCTDEVPGIWCDQYGSRNVQT